MKLLGIDLVDGTDIHQLECEENGRIFSYFFAHEKDVEIPKNWRELIVWDYTKTNKLYAKLKSGRTRVAD